MKKVFTSTGRKSGKTMLMKKHIEETMNKMKAGEKIVFVNGRDTILIERGFEQIEDKTK